MDALLAGLERSFVALDARSRGLIEAIDDARLFARAIDLRSPGGVSVGESLVRSAAIIEKTFNGITTRLWDDPFEWTLPEKLSDKAAVLAYLDEVETVRKKGFSFFTSDAELGREIPAPERLTPMIDILLRALVQASHAQGRAVGAFQMLTGTKPPAYDDVIAIRT